MTEVLWQTQQISTFGMNGKDWGKVDLRLDGTAGWYFERRQALRRNRAGAFVKKAGGGSKAWRPTG